MGRTRTPDGDRPTALILIIGVIALMIEPAIWLVETWQNAGYDSAGDAGFTVENPGYLPLTARSTTFRRSCPDPSGFHYLPLEPMASLASPSMAIESLRRSGERVRSSGGFDRRIGAAPFVAWEQPGYGIGCVHVHN